MRRGPLADSYPGAVGLVVFCLVPFLSLTAAILPVVPLISKSLGISPGLLYIVIALSDGGYAFGTVMAVQFAVHLPARRMLLVYVTLFLVASVLAAWAPTADVFMAAFVVQGLCTSLMLIAAVPPLVTGWPAAKMPITGAVMNLCIFGAVAIGPTIGEVQAASGSWRPLFWGVAGVAGLAVLFALLTYEDEPPKDRSAPWDFLAIGLAAVGCAAAFFGAGDLESAGRIDVTNMVPLLGGIVLIAVLVVNQYRARHPLMPVRQLATTMPVTGILIAMFASASSFGLMELILTDLGPSTSPTNTALLFLPEFGAAVATAALFGRLFRTRFTPVLAVSGLVVLTASAALTVGILASGGEPVVAAASGMIGLGVGASVSPALFIAGFSLRSSEVQRVFALIELIRGVTAFLVAPILLYLATTIASSKIGGLRGVAFICLGIAGGGGLLAAAVYALGGRGLQTPDLERWQGEDEPAWHSPPLLAVLRRSRRDGESAAGAARLGGGHPMSAGRRPEEPRGGRGPREPPTEAAG